MDEKQKKTLIYAGGGGLILAILYLATRSKGSAAPQTINDTSLFESLYSSVTEGYQTSIETLRGEIEGQIEGVRTETGAALEEQKTLFETFRDGINGAVEGLTATLNALMGRVTSLEEETANLSEDLAGQAADLQAESAARQTQALIVADTARLQAAQAAALSHLMKFGGSITDNEITRAYTVAGKAYDLSAADMARLTSWVKSAGSRLRYSGGNWGSSGLSFLQPVISGPMGNYVGSAFGTIPATRNPAPPSGEMQMGIRLS